MSSDAYLGGVADRHPLDDVPAEQYDAFRHPVRIRLLEVLENRSAPSLTEVTTALLRKTDDDELDGKRRQEVHMALLHNHLPRLADHDLIEWDREHDTVDRREDLPVCPSTLSSLLEEADDERAMLEQVVGPVRIRLIDELESSSQPLSLEQLAARLAAHEETPGTDRTKVGLHHSHLPALADVGVLEYDREAGLASLSGDVSDSV